MSGPQLAVWAFEALVASALLMALVLLVRVPIRRAFGPRVAYAVWLLPVLRMLLPPIPAGWRQSVADTPISRVGESITVILPHATQAGIGVTSPSLGVVLLVGWAIVAAGFLVFQLARHLSFCRHILARGTTIDRIDRIRVVESDAAAGPMAFGILRPTVAVPRDFAERFDADERALALAHELGHHARGDLLANWIALAVLALHWFNPLAWRAFRAFRADQELANDARVLAGRSAYERHAYACAIVKAAHGNLVGAACHLHSVKDLKGRLKMLRTRISPRRLMAGAAVVGGFSIAALGVTASGTNAAERIRSQVADATGIALPAPVTPETPETPVVPETSVHRVVVVEDGTTSTYEGEAARDYIAAHPAPPPPAPPVPPVAPNAPEAPIPPDAPVFVSRHGVMRINVDVPEVTSARCGGDDPADVVRHSVRGGRERITICTDRIERRAEAAQAAAADAGRMRAVAMGQARAGLRQARASMAAMRTLPEEARTDAVESIDDSIDELEDQIKQPEC